MPDSGGDVVIGGVIISVGVSSTAFWSGAHLAGLLSGEGFGGRWARSPVAAIRLVSNSSDLAGAWDTNTAMFDSPVRYWVCTALVIAAAFALTVVAVFLWMRPKVGLDRDDRLGVSPEARMATKAEMAPLMVKEPVDGRFSFGRVRGRIVATEDPTTQAPLPHRRRSRHLGGGSRRGDRTSIMVFGTSRSGKTSNLVPGVTEWNHPAILSSVKGDLMEETIARRKQIGTVYLFDPFDVVPEQADVERVSWSPVSCANTISGAIDAAQTLADASSAKDVSEAGFWTDRAAALLWPLLFTASLKEEGSMSDVLRWLSSQDGIDPDNSQVKSILNRAIAANNDLSPQAKEAYITFDGWTKLDTKPRSEQNSTSQSLVSCWSDPFAAAASDTSLTRIDMPTILSGRNTLYIVQPLGRCTQFAPLFGGLFGDLIRDQTYRIAQSAGGRARVGPLLALLDEAGNTPLRWLPQVASTCAGIGVQLVTVWQDSSQIKSLYGPETESVLNNHQTKLFFAGQSDQATMEYASMLCGEEEVTSTSASADLHLASNRKSQSAAPVTKRLVPVDMLRRMEPGTAMLVHNTLPPTHLRGRRMDTEPQLHALAAGSGPEPGLLVIDPSIERAFGAARAQLPERVLNHMKRTQVAAEESGRSFGDFVDRRNQTLVEGSLPEEAA